MSFINCRVNLSANNTIIARVLEEHGSDPPQDLWSFNPLNARTHSAVFLVKSGNRSMSPWVDAVTTVLVLNKRLRSHSRSFVSHGLYWSHTEFCSDSCSALVKPGEPSICFCTLWLYDLDLWPFDYKKYVLWITGIYPIDERVKIGQCHHESMTLKLLTIGIRSTYW